MSASLGAWLLLGLFLAYIVFTVLILVLVNNNAIKWGVWGAVTGVIVVIVILIFWWRSRTRAAPSRETQEDAKRHQLAEAEMKYRNAKLLTKAETNAERSVCIAKARSSCENAVAVGGPEAEVLARQRKLALDDCDREVRGKESTRGLSEEIAACKDVLALTGRTNTLEQVATLERSGDKREAARLCDRTL
jgi:hypothetical protein